MNTSILESKLKRLKISHSSENGKIIIGKPRTDYLTLIGFIAFPFFTAIGLLIFLFLDRILFFSNYKMKIFIVIFGLFSFSFFNFKRLIKKKQANQNLKILFNNEIQIVNEIGKFNFNRKNIVDFEFLIEQVKEEVFEGNMFLIDDKMKKHQILGFDDENEKYIEDDLNWFIEFLINFVKLKK